MGAKRELIFHTHDRSLVQKQILSKIVASKPTFVSHNIKQYLKPSEVKPSIVDQLSLVYQFKCDLCDAGYVGYTRQHFASTR